MHAHETAAFWGGRFSYAVGAENLAVFESAVVAGLRVWVWHSGMMLNFFVLILAGEYTNCIRKCDVIPCVWAGFMRLFIKV